MAVSDYNLPKLRGVISMTKLKNAFKRVNPDLVLKFYNDSVNGQLQGCGGFVTDPSTDQTVYVSTDMNHGTVRQALYRTAKNDKDYTGGRNHFCALDPEEIVENVIELLEETARRAA